ncbi:MAG: Hsp20/alpha crystallin family protein [Dehalococcoidales bacterium]|nr:Hsp20/alpha crystallin family protein [Dehalococcoidales bacterium]
MTTIRTTFANPISLRDAMDRLFEQSFIRSPQATDEDRTVRTMAVNLYEKDDVYYLQAYLPGVKSDNVDISIDGNAINIKARIPSRLEGEDAGNCRWYITELGYGEMNRSVSFPVPVDANRIEASQDNGVLTVTVPKAEEARPRQIKVKTA